MRGESPLSKNQIRGEVTGAAVERRSKGEVADVGGLKLEEGQEGGGVHAGIGACFLY